MEQSFDLVVLGAGSGGLAAAKRAARYGAKVAIVEGDRVGGTCVIRGCVPKKLLVYGSLVSEQLQGASSYGVSVEGATFDTSVLLRNVRQEVDRLNALHIEFLAKAGVELITGWGRFLDPHRIGVSRMREGEIDQVLQAKRVMISVGGRPVRPDVPGVELAWVSDDMFLQERFPDKVVVVGAGFIACEFAGILRGLGVGVTQLVRGEKLLRGFDSELSFRHCHARRRLRRRLAALLLRAHPRESKIAPCECSRQTSRYASGVRFGCLSKQPWGTDR